MQSSRLKWPSSKTKGILNLIHHSDRGVQYCSKDYVKLLLKEKIQISMTEDGDPLDNSIAERVNGILKMSGSTTLTIWMQRKLKAIFH
ncbi:MAG: DDE-type integrase/transposase/recombinase [Saprospiraceae bacterium]|nr:DDE-type integrase/transposase/recombinase [Saprospiraceae bacterium]